MSIGFSETSVEAIEIPRIKEPAPYIIDDCALALFLGYKPRSLWYFIIHRDDCYKIHRIPKKTRGVRVIHAPNDAIKMILQRLHVHFLAPLHDGLGAHVTAYRNRKSIKDAAENHIHPCPICDAHSGLTPPKHDCPRTGAIIHMDLKDFFSSTKPAWVRNYFKSLGYSHYVSNLLSSLVTVGTIPKKRGKRHLQTTGVPQGAPTSGAICNLVADHRFDQHVMHYLKAITKMHKLDGNCAWRYSRYADDITISAGKEFPKETKQEMVKEITAIIEESGYRINKTKTRYPHAHKRKQVLGVVVNQRTNVTREEYLRIRAIVHNCLTHGIESQMEAAGKESPTAMVLWLCGKVNYINQINEHKGTRLKEELEAAVANYYGVNHDPTDPFESVHDSAGLPE